MSQQVGHSKLERDTDESPPRLRTDLKHRPQKLPFQKSLNLIGSGSI